MTEEKTMQHELSEHEKRALRRREIGDWLKDTRRSMNLTQWDVAHELGYTLSAPTRPLRKSR